MSSSSANKLNVYFAAGAGLFVGFAFLQILPIAQLNPAFLFVLPVVCLLALGMVLDIKSVIALLLISRALLDPVLNLTKIDSLGLGIGALLNLFVVLLTLLLALKNHKFLFEGGLFKRWIIFLIIGAVTITYSPVPVKSVKLLFNLASYVCMALLPFIIQPEKNDKRFWIKIILFSSVLEIIFANVDMVRGGSAFADSANRIQGTFTHPNILAFYLVLIIAMVFYAIKTMNLSGPKRAILFLYLLNLFALMIATRTRNAWIACWLLFFIYGVIKERKFIFISIGAVGLALLIPDVASRIADAQSSGPARLNSFAWRVEVWKSSMPWIMDRPFTGYGLGSFQDLSRQFFRMERRGVDAHNTYVQILFETGVMGLISYLAIYIPILRTFWGKIRRAPGKISVEYAIALSYLLTYLISCYADNMFFYLAMNWYFWFFIGIMLKAAKFNGPPFLRPNIRRNPVV